MKKLIHLPLEAYKERYTEFLAGWENAAFSKTFQVETIAPKREDEGIPLSIQTGSVLDSILRPTWSLSQISTLINRSGVPDLGIVYASDFYTSGLDALAYSRRPHSISSFCWAQTFDGYDFTTKFIDWMRPWEVMAMNIYDNVFVASSLLKDLINTALPGTEGKVHVVGLPFDSVAIQDLWSRESVPTEQIDVVYSSRWDLEKNPHIFLDLVAKRPDLSFAICTGSNALRGTDVTAIDRATRMISSSAGNLKLYASLSKADYYAVLTRSKVQFNCALQDWVSFTLLEALTFGCLPLYPMTRSFPEALRYEMAHLYAPQNVSNANSKLNDLLKMDRCAIREDVLSYHNAALPKIATILNA